MYPQLSRSQCANLDRNTCRVWHYRRPPPNPYTCCGRSDRATCIHTCACPTLEKWGNKDWNKCAVHRRRVPSPPTYVAGACRGRSDPNTCDDRTIQIWTAARVECSTAGRRRLALTRVPVGPTTTRVSTRVPVGLGTFGPRDHEACRQ